MREQLISQPDFIPPMIDLTPFGDARIAISGTTGVLGGVLSERLAASGMPFEPLKGDVTDLSSVEGWIRRADPDLVFHFAAVVPVKKVERDPYRAYSVNALGPYHVAKAVMQHVPRAWLFVASSSHVYRSLAPSSGHGIAESGMLAPSTLYGSSKLAGEMLARSLLENFDTSWCIGRIFSFTHLTQKPPYLVPSLRARIAHLPDGGELSVSNPGSVRDILDAESVIDAVLWLALKRFQGTINIGSGWGISVIDLAANLATRDGRNVHVKGAHVGQPDCLIADVTLLRQALEGLP